MEYNKENMAITRGRNLSISTKHSIEVCGFIRNKTVKQTKDILKKVSKLKMAVPFRKYTGDLGHKKKIGPARYPTKAAKEILKLVEGVESNAQFKGLNTNDLVITHIKADKASKTWHYGRKRRRQMKRTNIDIIVSEKKQEKKEEKAKKEAEKKKK